MIKYIYQKVGENMKIGEKIRYYRELNNMTQEDVARKLHTTPQNIYKYEKGIIQNIPTSNIVALAEIFSVTPAELIGWADGIAGLSSEGNTFEVTPQKLEFGKKLRIKRESAGMTVKDLALKLHILDIIVENYEQGMYDTIETSRLKRIAELLNTPLEYFTDETIVENTTSMELTDIERNLILKYRANPEHRSAIHKLLELPDEYSYVYPIFSPEEFDNRATNTKVAQSQMAVYDISYSSKK